MRERVPTNNTMLTNPYEPPKEDSTWTATPTIGALIHASGQLTLEDFDRIQGLYGGGGRWQARLTYAAVIVIWLVFLVLNVFASRKPFVEQLAAIGMVHYMFGGGLLLFGLFLWLRYSLRRNVQKQYRNHEGMFAPQQLQFSDEGIALTTPLIQSRLSWDAFSSARINEDYLVLHLKPDGIAALHIARSWFADDGAWRRLFDFVLHRLPKVK